MCIKLILSFDYSSISSELTVLSFYYCSMLVRFNSIMKIG